VPAGDSVLLPLLDVAALRWAPFAMMSVLISLLMTLREAVRSRAALMCLAKTHPGKVIDVGSIAGHPGADEIRAPDRRR